jgi:hypothetical protein
MYTWYNYYCTNYCPSHLTCFLCAAPRYWPWTQELRLPGSGVTGGCQGWSRAGTDTADVASLRWPCDQGGECHASQCAWEGKLWKTNDLRWPENLRGVCFTLVMIYITWYSYVLCDRISLEKTNRTLDSGCVWSWSWKASTRPDHQCLQESPCTIVHNVKVSYYLFVLKRVHVDPLFPTRTYLSI